MSKTPEKIQEEINAGGVEIQACPICRSVDVDWGLLESNDIPSRKSQCNNCEASWTELYTWAGIDDLKKGGL